MVPTGGGRPDVSFKPHPAAVEGHALKGGELHDADGKRDPQHAPSVKNKSDTGVFRPIHLTFRRSARPFF
jgi:hypothetical protein